ncbi:MAG: hypothetical protein QF599_12435, partial [Planctomycetota bacterium]|nr:hypothetical protein [Planctomycetota bacterium]
MHKTLLFLIVLSILATLLWRTAGEGEGAVVAAWDASVSGGATATANTPVALAAGDAQPPAETPSVARAAGVSAQVVQ